MKTQTKKFDSILFVSVALLIFAAANTVRADESSEARISSTSQGQGIQRGGVGGGDVSHDEFEPLRIAGDRRNSSRGGKQHSSSAGTSKSGPLTNSAPANVDFWIYDADVVLYSDLDRDGYFTGIDLAFDADTVFGSADVYAVIYLSYELGPWNEYASTDDFTIFGASSSDEYFIETDLVAGYLTGEYDILIELFDTFDGEFVASFGPDDSSKLALLPLEDVARDTPPGTTTVVVTEGGGGSLSLMALIALFGFVLVLRLRESRS